MDIKVYFQQLYEEEADVISLTAIENPYLYSPLIDGLDLLLLVVSSHFDLKREIEHVRMGDCHVQVCRIGPSSLEQWLSGQEDRSIIQWLVRGEILLDRDNYMHHIRERLLAFPNEIREQRLLVEFDCFIRKYLQSKQDIQDKNIFDAYSNVLSALHHWAHIALIEAGLHPELTVWQKMRRFNPGIYKLYEELTVSEETLEERVQLVLLACEFSVMSKMKSCCELLFSVLASREEPWSIIELQLHPLLNNLHMDLSLLIHKLVNRGYVREVVVMPDSGDIEALELRYLGRNV